jgi:amino acid transporter
MIHKQKLSLPAAIMINVNIMLGTGIFINTTALATRAGALGFLGYLIVGVLMLPLILSISHLLRLHPGGGFYTFAQKEISPLAGFLSSWTFFVAKLASATLITHASVLLMQTIIPALAIINPLLLDSAILIFFTLMNMRNMRTGSTVQAVFITLKTIPILFAILVGLWLFNGTYLTSEYAIWSGIPSMMPLVLYACIGFEAAVSLSSRIKDPEKNAPLVIFISYGIVVAILALYQFAFYGALGNALSESQTYLCAFPALLSAAGMNAATWHTFLHLAIASSALGGAYGILFSNSWNLYALAEHKHLIGSSAFAKLNKQDIPWLCVLTELILCLMYLAVTGGERVLLQQISGLGVVFAYFMCVLSLIYAKRNNPNLAVSWAVPILGLGSAVLLMGMCIRGLLIASSYALVAFFLLLITGATMYFITAQNQDNS